MTAMLQVMDVHKGPQTVDLRTPGVLFCDVDGTVADLTHRRRFVQTSPKNWMAFRKTMDRDLPIKPVINAVNHVFDAGWTVVMMTARSEIDRQVTADWLDRHGVRRHHMYMRADHLYNPDGSVMLSKRGNPMPDARKDNVVKAEMLAKARADGFDPDLVFDDRDQVVEMWRENGIRCVQVAEGDF